jgi:signal transduction histidine kinase
MKRGIIRQMTIKQLLIVGIGGIMGAFIMLGAAWIMSVAQLSQMKTRLYTDARSLQTDHLLELAIVSASREELLWRATGDQRHRQDAGVHLREADRLVKELRIHVTAPAEIRLIEDVEARYGGWRSLIPPSAPAPAQDREALYGATDSLMAMVHRHRDLNAWQMQQTMRDGLELEALVRREMTLILPLALLAGGLGGVELWKRIIRPTLRLARAAEAFGAGDLDARAEVRRKDEINDLCRTFNVMANAIRDREKERLHFVATVAHDLKSPLTVIGGAAHLIRRKLILPEQQDEWMMRIIRNVRTLEGTIADLLDGVQAQTGQLQLRREEFDLAELAAGVVREQNEVLRKDSDTAAPPHALLFEGETTCPILGDRRRLERVLVNLLSNAVKYSPAGSEVQLTLWRRGTDVRLTVEDQGEGIAPEDLKRVLQPFTRLEGTRHKASGTGLGLVSVQKIIEAHGGDLNILSRPGHGTVIEIFLKGIKYEVKDEG